MHCFLITQVNHGIVMYAQLPTCIEFWYICLRVPLLNVFLFYDIFLLIIYFFTVYFTLLTVPKDKGKLKFQKRLPKHIYTCSKTTHKHRPPLNVSSHQKNGSRIVSLVNTDTKGTEPSVGFLCLTELSVLPGLGNVLFLSFLGPNELSVIVSAL